MKNIFLFFIATAIIRALYPLIDMYACPFCRRQEVYSPPAHLQQYERKDKKCKESVCIAVGGTQMKIEQVTEPCGKCPCLFGIPCPIITPCLFCPQGTHCHSECKEHPTYAHKTVADCKLIVRDFGGSFTHPQIDCKDGCCSHHSI